MLENKSLLYYFIFISALYIYIYILKLTHHLILYSYILKGVYNLFFYIYLNIIDLFLNEMSLFI